MTVNDSFDPHQNYIDENSPSGWSKKKQIVWGTLIGFALIIFLGGIKFLQIRAAIAQHSAMQPPPSAVTTAILQSEEWQDEVKAVATISAVQGAMLAAEEAGEVRSIDFESGDYVEAGTQLVQLNVAVEQAQLAGLEATVKQSESALTRAKILREKNANATADLDTAVAQAAQAKAAVESMKNSIANKTITAPFAGYTGVRLVTVGEYVSQGQAVVPLHNLEELYVDFNLPQNYIGKVQKGVRIRVQSEVLELSTNGTVESLDPNINEHTRNFSVRARVANPDLQLRPGMFVEVSIPTGDAMQVIPIPQSSVQYAPYGNSVWVVEEKETDDGQKQKVVAQQFVKVGAKLGDLIAVLDGLTAGQEIVTSGAFKLRPGEAIQVNNSVQPGNSESPNPENT